ELNPIEEANAYRKLLEKGDPTQEEVSQRVGKTRSSITNALRLLKLPAEIQKLVEDEKLSMGHARALLAVDSAEHQISIAHQIVTKSLSVRDAEQMVKRAHARTPANAQKRHGVSNNTEAPNIAAAETKLSKRLEAPVKIRLARAGGVVEIRFSSG